MVEVDDVRPAAGPLVAAAAWGGGSWLGGASCRGRRSMLASFTKMAVQELVLLDRPVVQPQGDAGEELLIPGDVGALAGQVAHDDDALAFAAVLKRAQALLAGLGLDGADKIVDGGRLAGDDRLEEGPYRWRW